MALRRRKPLELVFSLQWINDDKLVEQNIIGMVDTLINTINFEKFKSYLLKNSGVDTDDIKVKYVNNKIGEWVIDSQERFEAALETFRYKARSGEKIVLKLERIQNTGAIKRTTSVRTQCTQACNTETPPEWFVNYMKQFKEEIMEEIKQSLNQSPLPSPPPIKPTIQDNSNTDEVLLTNIKSYKKLKKQRKLLPNNHLHHHHHHCHNNDNPIDRELLRTLKYDRKLEIKLDKLDAKTKKIKEKKQALINKLPIEVIGSTTKTKKDDQNQTDNTNDERKDDNTTDSGNTSNDNNKEDDDDEVPLFYKNGQQLMDAAVIMDLPSIKHMCGGEIYSHTWNIINKGKMNFTDKTELRWTWGSAELKPETKSIKLPLLKPGETGSVKITFHIPIEGGKYESYWNFYHDEFRFGSWLSCTIIVDPPPKLPEIIFPISPSTPIPETNAEVVQQMNKTPETDKFEQLETASILTLSSKSTGSDDDNVKIDNDTAIAEEMRKLSVGSSEVQDDDDGFEKVVVYGISVEDLIVDLSKKDNVQTTPTLDNDDNNNNNVKTSADSRSPSLSSNESNNSYDLIQIPDSTETDAEGGDFVVVEIHGNKIPLPRHIINPEFLEDYQETNEIVVKEEDTPAESNNFLTTVQHFAADLDEFKSFISHCSTAGTNFSDTNPVSTTNNLLDSTIKKDSTDSHPSSNESRLFIFPQRNPGYEVVGQSDQNSEAINQIETTPSAPEPDYTWAQSRTGYTLADIPNRSVLEKFDPYHSEQQQQQQFEHVPNYQQTPKPDRKNKPNSPQNQSTSSTPQQPQHSTPTAATASNNSNTKTRKGQNSQNSTTPPPPVHILPENLVSGAVNVASSAINTARSVINMMIPPKTEPGRWLNGHWVTDVPESKRAKNLRILVDMGFWDVDYNATLLARHNDDLSRVVDELLR